MWVTLVVFAHVQKHKFKKKISNEILCNCEICLFLKRTPGELKSIEINKFKKKEK